VILVFIKQNPARALSLKQDVTEFIHIYLLIINTHLDYLPPSSIEKKNMWNLYMFLPLAILTFFKIHGGVVVSIVASQQKGSWFNSHLGPFWVLHV